MCARFPWLKRGWWANTAYQPVISTPQDEVATLANYKQDLAEQKASLDQEINNIEAQLKELKNKPPQE
jgi:hypothetical protein